MVTRYTPICPSHHHLPHSFHPFSTMSSRRQSTDNTAPNRDQDPSTYPLTTDPTNQPPNRQSQPRRSLRIRQSSATPQHNHNPRTPRSPSPEHETAAVPPAIPSPHRPVTPTRNSPRHSQTNSHNKPSTPTAPTAVTNSANDTTVLFAEAIAQRPYPSLHSIRATNFYLNSTASNYLSELSKPLDLYPLPEPDYSTRNSTTTPADHLRPNYSTAEALAYFAAYWTPEPLDPSDLYPSLSTHQIITNVTHFDVEQSHHASPPTLALIPALLCPVPPNHPLPPLPPNFLFLQPTPQQHYLDYAFYSTIFTDNPHFPARTYFELNPYNPTITLRPPYPYHIPLLYSFDSHLGPLPFAYYLTPISVTHLLSSISTHHYQQQNPYVSQYIRLYVLPLRFLCDLFTYQMDPILTLLFLKQHHSSIPYITYQQFLLFKSQTPTPPLPRTLIELNHLVSSLPLPQKQAHLPPPLLIPFLSELTVTPVPSPSSPNPTPSSIMANPTTPQNALQHTTNLYDSSRSTPPDPPTRLSEPASVHPRPPPRFNELNLFNVFRAPPTVNLTEEDADNFCRANPYSLSRAQVETFVAHLEDLYINTTPNTDTLPEARALRSLQRHLHHSSLAAHVQNLLNPNANLAHPKHLYWRQIAQQYVIESNHPPPQRHNLASAIQQLTNYISRQNQQSTNRPRPFPYNQSSNRPNTYRPPPQYTYQNTAYRPTRPPSNFRRPFRPQYASPRPPYGQRPALPAPQSQQGHTPIQQANIHFARNPARPSPRPPARPARPFQPARRPYNHPAQVHALTNDDSTEHQTETEDQHALADAQQCNETYAVAFPDNTSADTSYYTEDYYYTDDSYDPSQYPTYDDTYTEDPSQLYFH